MQTHPCDRASSHPVKMADGIHRVDLCQSCSETPVRHGLQLRVVQWESCEDVGKKVTATVAASTCETIGTESHSPEDPRDCSRAKRSMYGFILTSTKPTGFSASCASL